MVSGIVTVGGKYVRVTYMPLSVLSMHNCLLGPYWAAEHLIMCYPIAKHPIWGHMTHNAATVCIYILSCPSSSFAPSATTQLSSYLSRI